MVNCRSLFSKPIKLFIIFLAFSGCVSNQVKTDLQTLQQNPEQFKGKEVILTTTIKQVQEHQDAYLGKKVEITGFVLYKGYRGSSFWSFDLKDEADRHLSCYEQRYRVIAWTMPDAIIKRATRENEQVTIVGRIEKDLSVELSGIKYRGQYYNTNHLPALFSGSFY